MATFTAGIDGANMRYLFSWLTPVNAIFQPLGTLAIQSIAFPDANTAVVSNSDFGDTLFASYTGSGMTATGNVPDGGTYTSVSVGFGAADFGTLSGFGTANFADITGGGATNPYTLLGGVDTLNGSSGQDILFGGFGGNDIFNGGGRSAGGDDLFVVGAPGNTFRDFTFNGSADAGRDIVQVIGPFAPGSVTMDLRLSTFFSIDRIELDDDLRIRLAHTQLDTVANPNGSISNSLQLAGGSNSSVEISMLAGGIVDLSSWSVSGVAITVAGSSDGDVITGTANTDASLTLIGFGGDDTINALAANANVTGGTGNDTFSIRAGQNLVVNDFKVRYFTASLSGANEVPPVVTSATGSADFQLDADRDRLVTSLFVDQLTGNATGAHIHRGAAGVNGPVVFDLAPPATTTFSINRTWTTGFAAEVANLLAGGLYINVHTPGNPNGEIRGQITLKDGDQGADRVNVSELNIATFATLQDIFQDSISGTALELYNDGFLVTALRLHSINEASLVASDFIYSSSNFDEAISGSLQRDDLIGGLGNDNLSGLGGDDRLYGESGNDVLNGGTGIDRMVGGTGNDTYHVDSLDDVVLELAGNANGTQDTIISTVNIRLDTTTTAQGVEHVGLTGAANATVVGSATFNVINGNSGNNYLAGYGGNDTINGFAGDDLMFGGEGKDTMTGGLGNDRFYYNFIAESGGTQPRRDVITDFSQTALTNDDWIDLAATDANGALAGNQAFVWRGTAAFTGAAGELRYFQDVANNRTIIEGQVRVDAASPGLEFSLELTGLKTLTAGANNTFDIIL